jgi:hypothetical protein
MEITYKQIKSFDGIVSESFVQRLPDTAFIHLNAPDNIDSQAYLKWLAEGNTPLPADEVTSG